MSNPAHEALLRQGVAQWNEWRTANGAVTPDLSGVRLTGMMLNGADLSHAKLEDATLIRAQLEGADLRYADLRRARLQEANLTDADLFRANLAQAALASARLRRTRLFGANLERAQLTVVDFRKADLREANLARADLRESVGVGASLEGADLSGTELFDCHLEGSNLERVRGLTSRQIEDAIVDETTRFGDSTGGEALASLCHLLEAMRARAGGNTVSESVVSGYHALLENIEAQGVDTRDARIRDDEIVRPLAAVDATLFRRKVDEMLGRLSRRR